jgi:hypothetical protein
MQAEGITGANADENAQLVNPPFWKGAPFAANLGRTQQFT